MFHVIANASSIVQHLIQIKNGIMKQAKITISAEEIIV